MSPMYRDLLPMIRVLLGSAVVSLLLSNCGGNSTTSTIIDHNPPPTLAAWPATTDNFVQITADSGPPFVSAVNTPYITVYLCMPGSTNLCQKIDHILVDTGSYGFRVMKSKLASNLSLQQVANASGTAVFECTPFVSGFMWGPVVVGDVRVGGEVAPSIPVQIIDDSASPTRGTATQPAVPAPTDCSAPNGVAGADLSSVSQFGANGVLGIGVFIDDCGPACTPTYFKTGLRYYYACPTSTTCAETALASGSQVMNPIARFASVNFNGSVIEMPNVPTLGAASPTGNLIFGINTQTNNQLGSATVLTVDPATGNFSTTFPATGGSAYPSSYIDSGSNAIYLPDTTTLPSCSAGNGFLCPTTATNYAATNTGLNAVSSTVNFTIVAADVLFANSANTGFNDLGASTAAAGFGSNTTSLDWGMPFFYGRSVFTAIEQTTVSGISAAPPFNAY